MLNSFRDTWKEQANASLIKYHTHAQQAKLDDHGTRNTSIRILQQTMDGNAWNKSWVFFKIFIEWRW